MKPKISAVFYLRHVTSMQTRWRQSLRGLTYNNKTWSLQLLVKKRNPAARAVTSFNYNSCVPTLSWSFLFQGWMNNLIFRAINSSPPSKIWQWSQLISFMMWIFFLRSWVFRKWKRATSISLCVCASFFPFQVMLYWFINQQQIKG